MLHPRVLLSISADDYGDDYGNE